MFKHFKVIFYILIALAIVFLYWFLPIYSLVHKNPGYCANLTTHLYYCGNEAGGGLEKMFGK